jgi:uncharacterized glyoxalase superfamily protein PhnB
MAMRVVPKAILPVAAMKPAAAFYRQLGFNVEGHDDGYAWVGHRGDEILHLRQVPGLDRTQNAASCYLHVRDADEWHATWTAAGVTVGPITDQPWGMREFALTDPSGNLIRVGHNI